MIESSFDFGAFFFSIENLDKENRATSFGFSGFERNNKNRFWMNPFLMMDLFGPIIRAEARVVGVENIPTTPVTLLESLFPGLGNCLQIKLPPGEFFLKYVVIRDFLVWLRTGPNPLDINRFRSYI